MPKQSKAGNSRTHPKTPKPKQERKEFYCTRCGKKYTRQRENFMTAMSPIWTGNDGYFSICNHCIDDMEEQYTALLDSHKAAVERICLKLDAYWSERVWDKFTKTAVFSEIHDDKYARKYLAQSNRFHAVGRSYDDTLSEMLTDTVTFEGLAKAEKQNDPPVIKDEVKRKQKEIQEEELGPEEIPIIREPSMETVMFWGSGFSPEAYFELDMRYKMWTNKYVDVSLEPAEEAIFRQICILEMQINEDRAAGKPIAQSISALNSLLGSANLKPIQKREEELKKARAANNSSAPFTFGTGIRKWEDNKPIPEPDPEFEDVDGIARYISIWFFGHLCKMLKLKNSYSRLYEEEIEKLKVTRPEYEGDDDNELLANIFGDSDE